MSDNNNHWIVQAPKQKEQVPVEVGSELTRQEEEGELVPSLPVAGEVFPIVPDEKGDFGCHHSPMKAQVKIEERPTVSPVLDEDEKVDPLGMPSEAESRCL